MPRPAPPRTRRGRESRERVLDRAIELFAAHGFAAVTMRALREAAGLDNSSLYRHFPSKTALANALLDRVTAELLEVLAPKLAGSATPSLAALADAAAATGLHLFDRPQVARILMHWVMSTGEADASLAVSVRADDTRRPIGRLKKVGAKVKVERTGDTSAPLVVSYTIGGTAQNGIDYEALPGTIEIPAGKKSAKIVVRPRRDGLVEGPETIEIEVVPEDDYAPSLFSRLSIELQSQDGARKKGR